MTLRRAGADTIDGGVGYDFAWYIDATTGVTARLDFPSINSGDAAGDVYVSIEGLVGSNFPDFLVGDAAANWINALNGDDYISGQDGNDTLLGSDGNDNIWGDAGADFIGGGNGFDIARYDFAPAGVVARLDIPGANSGEAQGDTYVGIEGIYGSAFADVLVGGGQGDVLAGLAGSDTIYGRLGTIICLAARALTASAIMSPALAMTQSLISKRPALPAQTMIFLIFGAWRSRHSRSPIQAAML